MGDTISKSHQQSKKQGVQQYLHKLQYIQQMQQENLGSIEIYRLKQPPYEYIMQYVKTFIQGDNRFIEYMKRMQQLSKTQHKNLAKIHLSQLTQETLVCIKQKKTHTFCNYYNFNLQQAIKKKKQQSTIFTQSQLIYIMSCLIEVTDYLSKFNISIGQYRTRNVYLSPQGYVKLYLLEVETENRHRCYYRALSQRDMIDKFILSPQELYNIAQMSYAPVYDIYKSDLFSIGFIIFELITQDDPLFYLNQNQTSYKFDRIHFHLDAVTKLYSNKFIDLVKCCLEQQPSLRPTVQQALAYLNQIKNLSSHSTYCIRLHDDQTKKKPQHKKSIQSSPQTLPQITKLMPSPITTLSSSSSSTFRNTLKHTAHTNQATISDFHLKKSPSLTSKTSENQSHPSTFSMMDRSKQSKLMHFQK